MESGEQILMSWGGLVNIYIKVMFFLGGCHFKHSQFF